MIWDYEIKGDKWRSNLQDSGGVSEGLDFNKKRDNGVTEG